MEMEMMTSSQDSGPVWSSSYHYFADHGGEATGGVGDGGAGAGFLEMFFGELHSSGSGDLFELVWQGGGPAGRSCRTETTQAAGGGGGGGSSLFPSSSSLPPPADQPPSEEEMAAWLYAIVRGDVVGLDDKPAGGGHDIAGRAEDDQLVPTAKDQFCTQDTVISNCSERGKQRGGSRDKSQHSETHSLTEKRRRRKINEKFKTLQQLVPGCDNKSNQTSTLEQTIIKYMKSLQHQIQAMSFCCRIKPASGAAYCPVVPPPYYLPPPPPAAIAPGVLVTGHVWPGVVLGPPPPAMLPPFTATLPLLPPHPAVMAQSPAGAHGAGSADEAQRPERWCTDQERHDEPYNCGGRCSQQAGLRPRWRPRAWPRST